MCTGSELRVNALSPHPKLAPQNCKHGINCIATIRVKLCDIVKQSLNNNLPYSGDAIYIISLRTQHGRFAVDKNTAIKTVL